MKILNLESKEEVSLKDWERRECDIVLNELTPYQKNLLFTIDATGFTTIRSCTYSDFMRKRIKTIIKAMMENEVEPRGVKIYNIDEENLFIISKHKLTRETLYRVFPLAKYAGGCCSEALFHAYNIFSDHKIPESLIKNLREKFGLYIKGRWKD